MRAIEWADGEIVVLDQTLLPRREQHRRLRTTEEVAEAIERLRVRGAPALGIVGAMGVAQAAMQSQSRRPEAVLARARDAGRLLAATRPTAVNLRWAIDRVLARAVAARRTRARDLAAVMVEEALEIQREDERACVAMAEHALEFFPAEGVVVTHCNTGALCTGGEGTALGAIKRAHRDGRGIAVLATETRPLLQGARLTVWELGRSGIPHALVVDGAAPGLIARGEVSLVVVGADRIAANGDVANKVGTYPLALAAREAGVPFVVVAPTSTIDVSIRDGSRIPVEERPAREVTWVMESLDVAPPDTDAINPAFDITPASLVTAVVTERGVARAPFTRSLARLLAKPPAPARAKAVSAARAARPPAAAEARVKQTPVRAKKPATKAAGTKRKAARPKAPVRGKAGRATRSSAAARRPERA